jgi:hypothetical protein
VALPAASTGTIQRRSGGRAAAFGIVAAVAATIATRWALRSRFLFSHDSANFALAMARIDIAAHRPHPPGYLAYVFAARALDRIFHDPNTALVAWNIAAAALAVALVFVFARRAAAESGGAIVAAVAAALILLTSPLFWFYNEVAEI